MVFDLPTERCLSLLNGHRCDILISAKIPHIPDPLGRHQKAKIWGQKFTFIYDSCCCSVYCFWLPPNPPKKYVISPNELLVCECYRVYSRSERLVVQVENDLCSEQTIVVDETATKNATCLIELARPRRPLERARRAAVSWNYTEEFHSCLLGLPALARTGENCWIAGCLRVEGGGGCGGCGGVRRGGGWRKSNYDGAAQSKSPPKYYSVASSFP